MGNNQVNANAAAGNNADGGADGGNARADNGAIDDGENSDRDDKNADAPAEITKGSTKGIFEDEKVKKRKKKEKVVATVNKNFLKDVDERIKTLIEKNRDQA